MYYYVIMTKINNSMEETENEKYVTLGEHIETLFQPVIDKFDILGKIDTDINSIYNTYILKDLKN